MSKVAITGNPSGTGTLTIAAPNTNTDRTLTLPDASGTVFVSGQALSATTGAFSDAVSATSGTFSGAVQVSGVATNIYPLVSATAVASTSGASIDFTGIPSWVKRITVMLAGISTNGSSNLLIQLGDSGGVEATGYLGAGNNSAVGVANYTTGFGSNLLNTSGAVMHGAVAFQNISANSWIASGCFARSDAAAVGVTAGSKTLSATLDRIRITTVNGTDAFDAGTINIMYE